MRTTNKLKIVIIVLLVYIATIITVKAQPPGGPNGNPPHGWGNHPWGNPPGLDGCFQGPCIPADNYIWVPIILALGLSAFFIKRKIK